MSFFPTMASPERRQQLLNDISHLKQEHRAVVLAHVYERLEVQDVADYTGDSLGLSQEAAATEANTIVFCGVHFMAETAKLLSPEKTVYLANPNAGCPMADMITAEQLRAFKARHPGVPVVGYVNTSADVKAECDICCTSANAVAVVTHLTENTGQQRILFVPDKHLGHYVQQQLPHIEVICWDGFCPTHMRMDVASLDKLMLAHPNARVLVHPECDESLKEKAHYIGSTTGILAEAHQSTATEFIICTEEGVAQRLTRDLPHKTFYSPDRQQALCPNMKMTRLENIKKALTGHVAPIEIPQEVFVKARQAIERMLAVGSSGVLPASAREAGSAACRCSQPLLPV
ncbi:MAG: quinolinate synthase NadA [Vampirovibrionales bacterium]